MTRAIGILLIVLGLAGLIYGSFTYVKDKDSVEIGPLEMTVEKKETITVPPILGIVGVLAGTVLLVMASRRREA